jgi:predicted MFS family arabinose efflux permease
VGRTLVIIGLLVAGCGLAMMAGFPLGRLPGDFKVERGAFTFYFPLTSSLLVSLVLTVVFSLVRR